jgi:opacity protein-like surface antigen
MKRSLFLATSVIALMAVSDQLLAAGAETPAPSERAAPAARRAAPERARPAPTPQRQAASQPSSSFTGTQAGGFGGGNAGGGGFADPAFCGVSDTAFPLGFSPRCGTSTQNIGKGTGVLGGLELGQMIPMGGYWALGWAVDAQGSTLRSEGTDQFTRQVPSISPGLGNVIRESFSTSQTQPFGTTLRLKAGVMAWPGTMIYVTGGGAGGMVHGDFNWTAVQTNGPCATTPIPASCTASAANTYDKFRWGYTVGGGVSFGFITVEYLHTDLGTVDQTIIATQGSVGGFAALPGVATTSMKTKTDAIRVKFSIGL